MNILIINTAFDIANYIVMKNGEIFAKRTDSSAKHSETSLVMISEALNDAKLTFQDIDVVAVNLGAGSFTGIRIGVALAKGFACGNTKIKLIGFNSFEPLLNKLNGKDGAIFISSGKDDYYVCSQVQGQLDFKVETNNALTNYENVFEFSGVYEDEELCNMVLNKIDNDEFCLMNDLTPFYMKLSQAEQDLINKDNKQD